MKKNLPYIIAAISLLAAAAGVAFGISATSESNRWKTENEALQSQLVKKQKLPKIRPVAPEIIQVSTNDSAETAELKKLLAEKEQELIAMRELAAENMNKPEQPPRQRQSWEDRMAKMKEEDPEGYAEMIQRRTEQQQKMKYNIAERTTAFMDMDTSLMSDEELASHNLLVDNMARIFELTEQFNDPEAAPDREAMRELFETVNQTRPLMQQERAVMFKQLGTDIGYEGEDASAFATHIDEIIQVTTIPMPRGGGRGGFGGGGGR